MIFLKRLYNPQNTITAFVMATFLLGSVNTPCKAMEESDLEDSQVCRINSLPPETGLSILSFLEANDLYSVMTTCSHMYGLCQDDSLWKGIASHDRIKVELISDTSSIKEFIRDFVLNRGPVFSEIINATGFSIAVQPQIQTDHRYTTTSGGVTVKRYLSLSMSSKDLAEDESIVITNTNIQDEIQALDSYYYGTIPNNVPILSVTDINVRNKDADQLDKDADQQLVEFVEWGGLGGAQPVKWAELHNFVQGRVKFTITYKDDKFVLNVNKFKPNQN